MTLDLLFFMSLMSLITCQRDSVNISRTLFTHKMKSNHYHGCKGPRWPDSCWCPLPHSSPSSLCLIHRALVDQPLSLSWKYQICSLYFMVTLPGSLSLILNGWFSSTVGRILRRPLRLPPSGVHGLYNTLSLTAGWNQYMWCCFAPIIILLMIWVWVNQKERLSQVGLI